ncbi:MAG: PAS domain S-box protein, partial [Planctomycetes bacterium]|nr:PAS domain S-box protein [Planctomycetota bacterium]
VQWRRPDGEIAWALVNAAPLMDERGRFRGAFAVQTDITDRKQMELALLGSEARFRSLAELTEDIVSLMTVPDDRKVYANPAYYRASGYTPEEVANTDWRERIHADDLPRLEEARKENLNGRTTRVEYRFRLKNGRWVWHENCAAPILDASSKVTHILCSSRDVTERHQKDEQLRASESEFRMLAEHLADVISLGDRSGRDVYISPAFERITGYTLNDLLAVPWQTRIHPEDVERLGAAREANWAGETNSVEYRYRTKDGRWIWFETRARPIRSSDGSIARVLLSSRDITERKQAERALQESAARQRAIFSSLVEGVILWDSSRRIATANESAARILGVPLE